MWLPGDYDGPADRDPYWPRLGEQLDDITRAAIERHASCELSKRSSARPCLFWLEYLYHLLATRDECGDFTVSSRCIEAAEQTLLRDAVPRWR
ncbi:MAG: hypothetical protein M3O70_26680 [Actinomycetota bacterium]|nr:hypothetical protein [Actinomycetota bacterium]